MRPYYNYDNDRYGGGGGPGGGGVRMSFGGGWTRTVKILIITNALMYLLSIALEDRGVEVFKWMGFNPDLFLRGAFWQPITYMFLHDPYSIRHLLLNMLGLFMFGGQVEQALGTRSFLVMYFTSGIVGALLCLIDPASLTIGASGGVFGVLIAFAVLFPTARILLFFIIPVKARYVALFMVFITVASIFGPRTDNVAHWGHMGGIVVGFLFAKLATRLDHTFGFFDSIARLWRRTKSGLRERRSAAEQAELDRLLEKVHREGITALTNRERDFLNQMSKKFQDRQ